MPKINCVKCKWYIRDKCHWGRDLENKRIVRTRNGEYSEMIVVSECDDYEKIKKNKKCDVCSEITQTYKLKKQNLCRTCYIGDDRIDLQDKCFQNSSSISWCENFGEKRKVYTNDEKENKK